MSTLRFLDFELDRDSFSLRRAGTLVDIDPKPLEMLFLLAERNGSLVTRDEALNRVWGEGVFIDGESALYTAVKKIRRAVGDPGLVLTVSGRGYRLNLPREPIALPAASPRAIERLAVLPLVNLSAEAPQDYFSDGLTDELISTMARLFGVRLTIVGRTSIMRFKGAQLSVEAIAHELSADYLIEGSVRRDKNRVRIAVQLLRAADSCTLWTDTFERGLTDIFQIQSEIALATAHAVHTKLSHAPQPSLTVDPEVHDLVLRARHLWAQRTRPMIEAAVIHFRQALTLDPVFAPAYSGLAFCYAILPITSNARPSACFPLAQEIADQALAITPASLEAQPEAHIVLGLVQFWYWRNWPLAFHHFQQAELLNPSDSNGPMFIAHVHSILGQHNQAILAIERAQRLDPFSPIVNTHVGHFLYNAGRFSEALKPLSRILEIVPQFWVAHLMRGKALALLGQQEEAIESFDHAYNFSAGNTEPLSFKAFTLAPQRPELASAAIAELEHQRVTAYASPVHVALAHLGLGNRGQALDLLDQALEERDLRLIFLAVESRWNILRESGDLDSVLRRIGLRSSPLVTGEKRNGD